MPQTFDLLLKGGTVVNHDGRGVRDVGVIGGAIAGIYGWLAAREHVFMLPASLAPAAPVPAETASIESVLDELLAGKITRDEATAQIRQLPRSRT